MMVALDGVGGGWSVFDVDVTDEGDDFRGQWIGFVDDLAVAGDLDMAKLQEAIARIRKRTTHDHAHGVIQVASPHLLF